MLCDAEYDKGGWVVIQYRFNGSEDFFRNWTDYESGFGTLDGEFWLGNEKIYQVHLKELFKAFIMNKLILSIVISSLLQKSRVR